MSEQAEDKGSSAWYRVPTWDGSPLTWRAFKREMSWWVSSLDLESTRRYNLAARWLLRQTGIVRQRGEEFSPSDLEYKPAVEGIDPETNEVIEITGPDYLFGLNKLLDALEGINGLTALDKRGELRSQFYTELRRRPGERLSEFCTRFRTAIADLRAEGVALPTTEVGWFFRDKLGLDPLRKQLLDTALHGREEYEIIEAEALRLFKDLHLADPLYRKAPDRKMSIRRMFQSMGAPSSSSSAPSTASTFNSRQSQASRFSDSSRRSSVVPGRKVMLTEVTEMDEPEEISVEEVNVAEADDGDVGLEEMLRSEAEVLAAELQEAEDQGIDADVLESIEGSFEQAAETLVTMKEARSKLQEIKKDRGYNKPKASSKFAAATPASKKQSGSHPCFDCMEHGHWAGDPECKRPGAGLGRKPGAKSKPSKQVRLTEALEVGSQPVENGPSSVVQPPVHEASMVVHYPGVSLGQALNQTLVSHEHSIMASSNSKVLAEDKHLVGALDSACNRTCAGPQWLDRYLLKLQLAPQEISNLVVSVDESENFRFGNGGVVPSGKRWRLPCSIGGCIVLVWVSLVPVASLGCLLGRDFLDAVGAVLDFGQRTLDCTFLCTGTQRLQQMSAGHFMLQMIPEQWTRPAPGRWRRCGQDGIVELQMTSKQWLDQRLREGRLSDARNSHDHMLTESSLMAGREVLEMHNVLELIAETGGPLAQEMRSFRSLTEGRQQRVLAVTFKDEQCNWTMWARRSHQTGFGTEGSEDVDGRMPVGVRTIPLEENLPAIVGSKGLALVRIATLAFAALVLALLAISLSIDLYTSGVVSSDRSHGSGKVFATVSLSHLGPQQGEVLHSWEPVGAWTVSQSSWTGRCIHGRQDVDGNAGGKIYERSVTPSEGVSNSGSQDESISREHGCQPGVGSKVNVGTSWWTSSVERRLDSVGRIASCGSGCKGYGAKDSSQDSAYGAVADEQQPWWISVGTCDSLSWEFGTVSESSGESAEGESTNTHFHEVFMVASGGRSGWSGVDDGSQDDGRDGRAGRALPVNAESGDDPHDEHAESSSASRGGYHGGRRDNGMNSEFRLANAKPIKRGVRMMITQAWEKHRREQKAVSVGTRDVMEVLVSSWEREMKNAMHETFSVQLTFPNPFLAEIFTDTEQVAKATIRKGLIAGDSLSLMTGWDFLDPKHRDAARSLVKRIRPYVLVLAFPCGPWSLLQNLNPAADLEDRKREARELVLFTIELALLQLSGSRHFLIENPLTSRAWKLHEMLEFMARPDVLEVVVDMCSFNLRSADGDLHKKATRLLTSSQTTVSALMNRRCTGDHAHCPIIGGAKISAPAGHYTKEFAEALVESFMLQYDFETAMLDQPRDDHETLTTSGAGRAEHEVCAVGGGESDDELEDLKQPEDDEVVIPGAIRAAVHRLHVNTGHRSNLRLARALLICGAPREAVLAAKRLKCDVCMERKPPKARLPASLPPPREVGQQVHIDLVLVEDSMKKSYVVAHATDHVSRFQAAQVLEDKSTASVIKFLKTHWMPLLGRPSTLVADQGREFVSAEFCDWCDAASIYLYHIGVGAPWQNGVAERSGGTLKALIGAITQSQAVGTFREMEEAVAEATTAYNSDINQEGVAPLQVVTGRVPPGQGDVLSNFSSRLAEHSLISVQPSLAKQVAMREVARLAMVRLHYSRGLRQAELARSRATTVESLPQPGDIVFFWRAQKYNSKKADGGSSRRRLILNRWHGPGLLVALEGQGGDSPSSNCFISFRGQLTKCPVEHVRKASSLENLAAGSWEAAIEEVIEAARLDAVAKESAEPPVPVLPMREEVERDPEPEDWDLPVVSAPAVVSQPVVGLTPSEIVAAIQPQVSQPASALGSRVGSGTETPLPRQLSSVPMSRRSSGVQSFQRTLERARSVDDMQRGQKRPAEGEIDRQDPFGDSSVSRDPVDATSLEEKPAFDALTMTWEQLCNVAESQEKLHPLLRLQSAVEMDRRSPVDRHEGDHGSWDGRWAMLCEEEWSLQKKLGLTLPCGDGGFEACNVQASRKEYHWSKMSAEQRKLWGEAAIKGWLAYIDNRALDVLSLDESRKVRQRLAQAGELDKILQPRFVLTDKHDGLRTASHPLPVMASARIVVPGFRDRANLEGNLRKDAPTGSRLAQHFLFCVAAYHKDWVLMSADVKSAFLKGDPYMSRELYISGTNSRTNPEIPLQSGQLARVLKGIFGLADAPREWWLRLSRAMDEHKWTRSILDAAMWCFWKTDGSGQRQLAGVIVAHVDDLLFTGSGEAERSLGDIGKELGFGSLDRNDFSWCGKRIRRAQDHTIRISMQEYHENIGEVHIPRHRKSDPSALLDVAEAKKLRGLLGSMQWMVAQVRFDMSFGVSTLQGESPPRISTLLKANQLVKEFKRHCGFELIFRPIDYRKAGIVVVSDAALGNVKLNGSNVGEPHEKVYSQACYFALLSDEALGQGKEGGFNILDARSHRIPRVCRSTYAAETLGCEESLDVGQLCRGFLATLWGHDMLGRKAEQALQHVKLTAVVDAKDVHDKSNSDTATFGSQKSLAFTITWMRSVLRQSNTALKWTSTENMWVDGGTKDMDLSHMRRIMQAGRWSISFSPDFVKQVSKARTSKPSVTSLACAEFPGVRLSGDDPLLGHMLALAERRGWHFSDGIGINVAFNAKSYRTPEPRFSSNDLPLRSSFGRFKLKDDQFAWHRLETGVEYTKLANQHGLIGMPVPILVTLFHANALSPEINPFPSTENGMDVKASS